MKKFTLVLILGLVCLTGCGKKGNEIVCTGTADENGEKVTMKVTASMKKEKIDTVKAVMSFSKKETAEQMCSLFSLANSLAEDESKKIDYDCDGKTITFKDYSKILAADDDANIIGITKDEFVKTMEAQDLKCK